MTYGEDPALGEKAAGDMVSSVPSVIPAYGVKSGTSAFVALVETGAEISSITETRRQGNGTYNRVGPTFRVTDTAYSGDEESKTICRHALYRKTRHLLPFPF